MVARGEWAGRRTIIGAPEVILEPVRIARSASALHYGTTSYDTVCLSVRLSITFRCFVQANEDTIVRFYCQVAKSFYFLLR